MSSGTGEQKLKPSRHQSVPWILMCPAGMLAVAKAYLKKCFLKGAGESVNSMGSFQGSQIGLQFSCEPFALKTQTDQTGASELLHGKVKTG